MPEESLRIREDPLVVPALVIASRKRDGYVSTAQLVMELEAAFGSAIDPETGETHSMSERVERMIGGRGQQASFIENGYADRRDDGIRITDKGRRLLAKLGYG